MTDATLLPRQLRVVFTGHAGTSKAAVAERFVQFVIARLKALGVDRSVAWADAEERLKPMAGFLALERSKQQLRWASSVTEAIESLADVDYAFLSLHLSYRSYDRFLTPLSWRGTLARKGNSGTLFDLIGDSFKPDYCVCLIDDIHAAQHSVAHGSGGFHLRLGELLAWRNLETLFTDLLAQEAVHHRRNVQQYWDHPFDRSPLVANRHPRDMLFKYLLEPTCLRVYASYPITRTRYDPARRAEIDEFRRALQRDYCVFDPVTIDELPLESTLDQMRGQRRRTLTVPGSARWPLDVDETLSGREVRDITGLRRHEIREIAQLVKDRDRTELERSVEDRDLRLIDQADCVVVYRPQYSTGLQVDDNNYQQPTGGTEAEIHYALNIAGKPVYLIHDPDVDGSLRRGTLDRLLPAGDDYFIAQNLRRSVGRTRAFRLLRQRLETVGPVLMKKRS